MTWQGRNAAIDSAVPSTGLVDARHTHRLQIAMLLLAGAILALLLIFEEPLTSMSLQGLCAVAAACSLVLCGVVFAGSVRGVWSVPVSYVAVFWVFHFGLVFAYAIGAKLIEDEARWLHQWFFRKQTHTAIVLATTGLAACVVGIYIAALVWGAGERTNAFREGDDARVRNGLAAAGFGCVALSLAGWGVIGLMSGGPWLFVSDYMTWLLATAGKGATWVYYFLGVGMTLLALGTPGPLRLVGFGLFGAWALVAFPLGLRGEVLFPLTTALVVMARRRVPMRTLTVVLWAAFLLVAIAVVRDLRMEGLNRARASSAVRANPLAALGEMGGSLRPVTEVVTWSDTGEDYLYGVTYWAPVERAITAFVPIWKRPPAEEDDRIMNVVVQERIGPIGFSVVAEAHRNFGPAGVPAVMFLVGLLAGWMESWKFTPLRGALLGIVFVELLFHVRNDFIAVPLHVALGTCLLVFIRFVARYESGRNGANRAAATADDWRRGGAGWGVNEARQHGTADLPDAESPRPAWGRRRAAGTRRAGAAEELP